MANFTIFTAAVLLNNRSYLLLTSHCNSVFESIDIQQGNTGCVCAKIICQSVNEILN